MCFPLKLRDDVQEETEVIMPTYCNRSEYKWFPKVVKASTIRSLLMFTVAGALHDGILVIGMLVKLSHIRGKYVSMFIECICSYTYTQLGLNV